MSSSLVFTGVGLKEHALGIPPVVYLHGEKSKNDGGVKVDVSARKRSAVFSCLEDEEKDGPGGRRRREVEEAVEESSESSSIGAASSSSSSKRDEEDGDEAESRKKEGGFGSFDSLEESLPIKRGLSNFFSGKSKSFASLADVATASASDLVKRENPFNKRRRILMAFKARRASYGSLVSFSTSTSSMSSTLLSIDQTVEEEGEGEEDDDDGDGDDGGDKFSAPDPIFSSKNAKKITVMDEGRFRSPRSFSLSDLRKY